MIKMRLLYSFFILALLSQCYGAEDDDDDYGDLGENEDRPDLEAITEDEESIIEKEKKNLVGFKGLLESEMFTTFFKNIRMMEHYRTEAKLTGEPEVSYFWISRLKYLIGCKDKRVDYNITIRHDMTPPQDPMNVKLDVVSGNKAFEFTVRVGTTLSHCEENNGTDPICVRSSDYKLVYKNHQPALMYNCLLVFWPNFRSGGRFCYKMVKQYRKISLRQTHVIVSAAGDDKQAVYIPVIHNKEKGWRVIKFTD